MECFILLYRPKNMQNIKRRTHSTLYHSSQVFLVISHPLFVLASLVKQRDRVHFPFPILQTRYLFREIIINKIIKSERYHPFCCPPVPNDQPNPIPRISTSRLRNCMIERRETHAPGPRQTNALTLARADAPMPTHHRRRAAQLRCVRRRGSDQQVGRLNDVAVPAQSFLS